MVLRDNCASPSERFDRRRFLISGLACGVALTDAPRLFAAREFWNTKDPSTWSDDEVGMLITKSPWAREAVPNVKNANDPMGLGDAGRGGRSRGVVNLIIRWESAQPILDAMKVTLPAEFAGHHMLSVSNLLFPPAPRPPRAGGETPPDEALERAQVGATLQVKGQAPTQAGIARRTRIGTLLFGFDKDYVRLGPGDREIIFKLDTGEVTTSAKFDVKEMVYRGKATI